MSDGTLEAARAAAGVRTARLSDGVTAYRVYGEAGPWAVAVHGLVTPMYAWEPLATALAAGGFRVLCYDQLGRGLSDRPRVRYDLGLYVRQLRELAGALGIDAAHFISWSMGGNVSGRLALDAADLVRGQVLIAPGLFLEAPLRLRVIARLPCAEVIIAALAGTFIDGLPAEHLAHPERFPGYLGRMREQLRYPGLRASFASTLLNFPWGMGPELRQSGEHPRPVLLVWGDKDPATPYSNVPRVKALYPRAELVTLRGARHAPQVERAEEVGAAILDFLRRAEARGAS